MLPRVLGTSAGCAISGAIGSEASYIIILELEAIDGGDPDALTDY